MYLNIIVTVIGAVVVFWFLYDIICRLLPHNHKKIMAKVYDKSIEYIDAQTSMVAEFENGNFEQSLIYAEQIISEQAFSDYGWIYKAYSLYHLNRYNEAKEAFELLNTLPKQNVSHMIEKINSN